MAPTLGEVLADRGLKNQWVAGKLGVSVGTVGAWVAGRVPQRSQSGRLFGLLWPDEVPPVIDWKRAEVEAYGRREARRARAEAKRAREERA